MSNIFNKEMVRLRRAFTIGFYCISAKSWHPISPFLSRMFHSLYHKQLKRTCQHVGFMSLWLPLEG